MVISFLTFICHFEGAKQSPFLFLAFVIFLSLRVKRSNRLSFFGLCIFLSLRVKRSNRLSFFGLCIFLSLGAKRSNRLSFFDLCNFFVIASEAKQSLFYIFHSFYCNHSKYSLFQYLLKVRQNNYLCKFNQ